MNDKKKIRLKIALLLFVLFGLLLTVRMLRSNNPVVVSENDNWILYYGDTCPHCKIVEDYLGEKDSDNRLGIVRMEVYRDKGNSMDLVRKAESCGFKTDSIGVPFLFDGQNCYVGDTSIIELINTKL